MKKKLEEFLELEKKATAGPWIAFSEEICKKNPQKIGLRFPVIASSRDGREQWFEIEDSEFIAQSRTVAPLAAQKLLEAVELLERVKNDAWFNHLGYEISREIKRFLEDFENEN